MLPYLTADVPAAGGLFKAVPEDFEVEELPAYEPNGEAGAQHLFVWVEKRGRSTPEVAKLLARHVGAQEREVSWAGLKDRQGVTRQYLCLPAQFEAKLEGFAAPGVCVLRSARHRNKLKSGHLRGNRFRLIIREVVDLGAAQASLERLKTYGIPNFFGDQRFGRDGANAARGKAILLAGGRHRDRFERKLFLSAFQSALFNEVLAQRLRAGTFATALVGDVLKKHETNGEFVCEAPSVDQPRLDAFELSPTGPMFGPAMRRAESVAAEIEASVLTAENVTLQTFEAGGRETEGTRRFFRVPLVGLEVEPLTDRALRLGFELPAGAYATVLLREVLKHATDENEALAR